VRASDLAALAAAAHELRVLLDAIPAPVFYKDAAGIYRGCNKAFEAYLGKTRDVQIYEARVRCRTSPRASAWRCSPTTRPSRQSCSARPTPRCTA